MPPKIAQEDKGPKFTADQLVKLQALFDAIGSIDGEMSWKELRFLGAAICGYLPSKAETKAQLARADIDQNKCLDFNDFQFFSKDFLAALPPDVFDSTIDTYTDKVKKFKLAWQKEQEKKNRKKR